MLRLMETHLRNAQAQRAVHAAQYDVRLELGCQQCSLRRAVLVTHRLRHQLQRFEDQEFVARAAGVFLVRRHDVTHHIVDDQACAEVVSQVAKKKSRHAFPNAPDAAGKRSTRCAKKLYGSRHFLDAK